MRGVRLSSVLRFFAEYCGEIVFEDQGKWQPLCQATTLARLCNEYNHSNREAGCPLLSTNLYAVDALFVRELTAAHRVSLAELWSGRAGARIQFFISHWWGEDFGEFCQSTYRFALTHTRVQNPYLAREEIALLAKDMSFYICAFSNNQWNLKEEMGVGIEDSPFYKVLRAETTHLAVMNVDQSAGALLRAWCAFEFYFAHSLDKPFLLNTRFGPLQELRPDQKIIEVWIRHMFEVLQDMDIRKARATKQEDLRMIQAHVHSFQGRGRYAAYGTGAEGLNRIFKRLVANEVLPLLARAGDGASLRKALESGADPNASDYRGVPSLTYAVALHGPASLAARSLVDGGATDAAGAAAKDVLRMFADDAGVRAKAIGHVGALARRNVDGAAIFREAVLRAQAEHTRLCLPRLRENLKDTVASVRLAAVKALGSLLRRAPPQVALQPAVREAIREMVNAMADAARCAVIPCGGSCTEGNADCGAYFSTPNDDAAFGGGGGRSPGDLLGDIAGEEDEDEYGMDDGDLSSSLRFVNYGKRITEAVVKVLGSLGWRAAPAVPDLAKVLVCGQEDSEFHDPVAEFASVSQHCAAASALRQLAERAAGVASLPPYESECGDGARHVCSLAANEEFDRALAGAAPALVAALADHDADVRDLAALALCALGPRAAVASEALAAMFEIDRQEVRRAAMQVFREIGPHVAAAAPMLAQILHGGSSRSRPSPPAIRAAAQALAALSSGAAPAAKELAASLSHDDLGVRRASTEALLSIGAGASTSCVRIVVRQLAKCAGEAPPDVRSAASRVLRGFGDAARPAVHDLAQQLTHQDLDVRREVAAALARLGEHAAPAAQKLAWLLTNGNEESRLSVLAVARGLGVHSAPIARELASLLGDAQDLAIRRAAAEALGRLGELAEPAAPELLRALALQPGRSEAADGLAAARHAGKAAAPPKSGLHDGAIHGDHALAWRVRMAAAVALGALGPHRCAAFVPQLAQALGDGDEDVRRSAAEALGQIAAAGCCDVNQEREVAAALERVAMQDEDKEVKRTAAAALHRFCHGG